MLEVVDFEMDLPLSSSMGKFSFGAFETVDTATNRKAEHFLVYLNLNVRPLNLRVNSACFTGDLFGDSRCDCHWQMVEFLRIIQTTGQGLLIYHMHHEGRGNGVVAKLKSYQAIDGGEVGRNAYESLGLKPENREYNSSALILHSLGINEVSLYSNNPEKITALENHGVHVVNSKRIKSTDSRLEKFYDWKRKHFDHHV